MAVVDAIGIGSDPIVDKFTSTYAISTYYR